LLDTGLRRYDGFPLLNIPTTNLLCVMRSLVPLFLLSALTACSTMDRLSNVGKAPTLSAIEDPTTTAGYKPVRLPMPEAQSMTYTGNSLWRTGSRAFFKDQRAQQIGDILTVRVRVTDRAQFDNQTKRSRQNRRRFWCRECVWV
jgi:flagellar L-ring protein FlgH